MKKFTKGIICCFVLAFCAVGIALLVPTKGQSPINVSAATGTLEFFNIETAVGGETGTGWSFDGTILTLNNDANIEITGTVSNGRRIEIDAEATVALTLNNLTIERFGTERKEAISIKRDSVVTLELIGENTLEGSGIAGNSIYASGCEVVINGAPDSILNAPDSIYCRELKINNAKINAGGATNAPALVANKIEINNSDVIATGSYVGTRAGINISSDGELKIINSIVTALCGHPGDHSSYLGIALNSGATFMASNSIITIQDSFPLIPLDGVEDSIILYRPGTTNNKVIGDFVFTKDYVLSSALYVNADTSLVIPVGVTVTNNIGIRPRDGSTIVIEGTLLGNKIDGANVSTASQCTTTLAEATSTSLTFTTNAFLLAATAQELEFAVTKSGEGTSGAVFQSGLTFTGLDASTHYNLYARAKENANFKTGTIVWPMLGYGSTLSASSSGGDNNGNDGNDDGDNGNDDGDGNGPNVGLIVGVTAGGILVVGAIGGVIFWFVRRRKI